MKKIFVLLFLAFGVICTSSTINNEEFTCPIGGEKFKQIMAMSGYQAGIRTDLKPYGAIIAPWPIPQCPENKLVMYKDEFTDKELADLKKIIESKEYKEIPKDAPTHYYLAKTYEMLNTMNGEAEQIKPESIAYAYLQSSWLYTSVRESALTKSLEYYKEIANSKKGDEESKLTANMLVGELSRLLGNFEGANKVFSKLKTDKKVLGNEYLKKIVDFEIKLIKEKNNNPEEIK